MYFETQTTHQLPKFPPMGRNASKGRIGITIALFLMALSTLSAEDPARPFPDLLIPEDGRPLPGVPTPAGTLIRNKQDFILCAGKDFQKPAAPGDSSIQWNNSTIKDVGLFNNETVTELVNDLSSQNNRKQALQRWEAGLNADPQFYPFVYNAARAHFLLRDFDEAIRLFERASALIPADPGPYMNIARACEEQQEHRCVVSYYKKAHAKAPLKPDAIYELGIYYLETDRRPQAELYLKRGFEQFPEDSRMKIGMARLLLLSGDRLRARVLLESIPTETMAGERRQDYDLSVHYYLANIYIDSRDYNRALNEINILLDNPSDPFFLKHKKKDLEKQKGVLERLAKAQN